MIYDPEFKQEPDKYFEDYPPLYLKRVRKGVYQSNNRLITLLVGRDKIIENLDPEDPDNIFDNFIHRKFPEYGVCDDVDQIFQKFPKLETCQLKIFVLTEIVKKENCADWRWEKWGPYIGNKISKAEYLKDEPEIEKVIIYKIYGLKG